MVARTDSACKFICEAGDWRVTNLQLQKILYFAQMVCLGQHGERLCDTGFEAWDYGPVAPRVYRKVRMFGSSPIENVFYDALPFGSSSRRKEILSDVCRDLLPMRPGALVEITHWSEGAWAKHYVPGTRGVPIPETDIITEYADRVRDGQITPER
jgi:uncharacterized phage-associated protein